MSKQSNNALARLSEAGLKVNQNDRLLIAELLDDLTLRDQVDSERIMDEAGIPTILIERRLNGPQKIERIKDALLALRYPTFTRARTAFLAELGRLGLSNRIKLTPVPYFEEETIKVEFEYRRPRELKEIIESLQKLAEKDLVKDALDAAEDHC